LFIVRNKGGTTCVPPYGSCITPNYSAFIAPVGQPSSQAPQSMQTSGSTTYLSAPSEIAPTGQVAAQAPQLTHSSEIACAISISSIIDYYLKQPPFKAVILFKIISQYFFAVKGIKKIIWINRVFF
jgi:hypothetical protein